MRVRDDRAADLREHVLGEEVASHGAGAHRHVRKHLRRHGGVHADVAEDHDVVGEDVVRVLVGQNEDPGLAREVPPGERLDHRPEEVLGLVARPAHHDVRMPLLHCRDPEVGRVGDEATSLADRDLLPCLLRALKVIARKDLDQLGLCIEIEERALR